MAGPEYARAAATDRTETKTRILVARRRVGRTDRGPTPELRAPDFDRKRSFPSRRAGGIPEPRPLTGDAAVASQWQAGLPTRIREIGTDIKARRIEGE